jgi:hypothetical protein
MGLAWVEKRDLPSSEKPKSRQQVWGMDLFNLQKENTVIRILPVCCLLLATANPTTAQTKPADTPPKQALTGAADPGDDQSTQVGNPGQTSPTTSGRKQPAKRELSIQAIRLRLLGARARLVQERYDEAIAIAQESLAEIEKLPDSVMRARLIAQLEGVIMDADTYLEDLERLRFQGALRRSYKADEVDALVDVEQSRRIPRRIMVYPEDWQALSSRRERYRDGIIYKGPEFRGENGELQQTIVYYIKDLTMPMRHFGAVGPFSLRDETRNVADRAALRASNDIFTGKPRDLAAGIPLLPYFGGVGETYLPPNRGEQEYADLMGLIEEILEGRLCTPSGSP